MSEWKFTYIRNEYSHYSPRQQPGWLVLQKDKDAQQSWAIAVDIAGALSK